MVEIAPPRLDWRTKGLPPAAEGLTAEEIGGLGLSVLDGDLMMPAALLRETAVRHNIAEMQAYADRIGAFLCPHGKTSLSPELFRMQMEAGAWGLTAATAHHVRLYCRLGIRRVFLANELVGRTDIAFVLGEIARDPDFDFYCLADSAEGVKMLADAAREVRCPRPIALLIETGVAGGRGGVREPRAVVELARQIKAFEPWVRLRGVETFEGIRMRDSESVRDAGQLLRTALDSAHRLAGAGLIGGPTMMLSAGGSAFLDTCHAAMPSEIEGMPVERVIRPGCYVTHDHGLYERITRPDGRPLPGLPDLQPALEVWGAVLSTPEPGLAIVGVGKRDVSYDVEPPIAVWRHRPGSDAPEPAEAMKTVALWDQHLALAFPGDAVRVGDLVGFGISHPCATFDRWTALLTVDESWRVTGAVTTIF